MLKSDFFKKTKTFSIEKNPEPFTISEDSVKQFLISIFERAEKLKTPPPDIDHDLWKWFNMTVPGIAENFETIIFSFKKDLTHSQILKEAENTGVKKIYSYLEALSIILEAVFLGELDEYEKQLLVYFQIKGKKMLYCFSVFCCDDFQLWIRVFNVGSGDCLTTASGVCFDNQ